MISRAPGVFLSATESIAFGEKWIYSKRRVALQKRNSQTGMAGQPVSLAAGVRNAALQTLGMEKTVF